MKALWQIILICACICCDTGKRHRETESSSRKVECHYCGEKYKYKDLQSHCDNRHGGQKARVKGVPSLGKFYASKASKKADSDLQKKHDA